MKIKLLAVGLTVASSLVGTAFLAPAFAATAPTTSSDVVCDRVSTRVDKRVDKYNTNEDKRITRYNKVKDHMEKVLAELQAKGKDVTKLKADLTTLNNMVLKFDADRKAEIGTVESAKADACKVPKGDYKGDFQSAKTESAALKAERQQIKDFIKNTIRPEIKALKA